MRSFNRVRDEFLRFDVGMNLMARSSGFSPLSPRSADGWEAAQWTSAGSVPLRLKAELHAFMTAATKARRSIWRIPPEINRKKIFVLRPV